MCFDWHSNHKTSSHYFQFVIFEKKAKNCYKKISVNQGVNIASVYASIMMLFNKQILMNSNHIKVTLGHLNHFFGIFEEKMNLYFWNQGTNYMFIKQR